MFMCVCVFFFCFQQYLTSAFASGEGVYQSVLGKHCLLLYAAAARGRGKLAPSGAVSALEEGWSILFYCGTAACEIFSSMGLTAAARRISCHAEACFRPGVTRVGEAVH